MRLRPILIGLTPNPKAVRLQTPLYGHNCGFLARISGLPLNVLHDEFERVNLFPEVHYGKLSTQTGHDNALNLIVIYRLQERDVFLLGEKVAACFFHRCSLFERVEHADGVAWTKIPHPSGLCRTWNEPMKRTIGGKLLRDAHKRWRESA